jgi:hypothetical protein
LFYAVFCFTLERNIRYHTRIIVDISGALEWVCKCNIKYCTFPIRGLFYGVLCFTSEHLVKTIGNHTPIIAEISGALEWICKCNIEYCTFRFHMVCSMLYFVLLRNTW